MAIPIRPKVSSVAANVPTTSNLVDGEFCINTADKIIYQRVGGSVVAVANFATGDNPALVLTDAATVAINTSGYKSFHLSTASSRTIDIPTNLVSGKSYVLAIKNTSAGTVTPTFTTSGTNSFRFGSDITAVSAIAAGKTDYYTFIFHGTDARCDIVGISKGY